MRARHRRAVVVLVVATLLALPLALGRDSRSAPSAAEARTPPSMHVASGAGCDDLRTRAQARSARAPLCTVAAALRLARPGDRVSVAPGEYPPLVLEGLAVERVVVSAARPRAVRLPGVLLEGTSGVTLSGFDVDGSVSFQTGTREAAVRDGIIRKGVRLEAGTDRIAVVGNRITAPRGSGVFLSSGPGEAPVGTVRIERNRFDDIGVVGVNARNFRSVRVAANRFTGVRSYDGKVHPDVIRTFGGGGRLVVEGNLIHDNAAQGVFVKDGRVRELVLRRNRIVRTQAGFKAVNLYDLDRVSMVENTIVDNAGGITVQGDVGRLTLARNILVGVGVTGTVGRIEGRRDNYIQTEDPDFARLRLPGFPRFVDPGRLDYRVKSRAGRRAGALSR